MNAINVDDCSEQCGDVAGRRLRDSPGGRERRQTAGRDDGPPARTVVQPERHHQSKQG